MFRTPVLAGVAAVAALSLSACGFSGESDESDSSSGASAPVSVLVPPPGTILSANSTKQLGTTVVDGNVATLYRFDRDSAEPPTATCVDDCAQAWPPVLTDPSQPRVLEGIADEAVGTVTRPDGTTQVTIGGWPVYRHASDAPGATDGNGVDGAWFAIQPDGSKAVHPKATG